MSLEFPLLYEDELLLSGCARYFDRMGYTEPSYALRDLFGKSEGISRTLMADLPRRIGILVQRLPPGYPATLDKLLQRHTFLPYYAPFLSTQNFDAAIKTMIGTSLGAHASAVFGRVYSPWRSMRYCPACVRDDRNHTPGGECFWHRLHQAPGVLVCTKHRTWLEESRIPSWGRESVLVSAERAGLTEEPQDARSSPWANHLEMLARESALLLDSTPTANVGEVMSANFQALLDHHNCVSPTGKVRLSYLAHTLIDHYSSDLLRTLGWLFEGGAPGPRNVARKLREHISQLAHRDAHTHRNAVARVRDPLPVLSILIASCLGASVEALLQDQASDAQIRQAPIELETPLWSCANPVCAHFQIPTDSVQVVGIQSSRSHHSLRLRCCCGYRWAVAQRPNAASPARERITVIDRGPLWDDELRRLWLDPSQKPKMIAQRLHVGESNLWTHVRRLGLPVPRDERQSHTGQHVPAPFQAQRREWRTQLLTFLQCHPSATRRDLAKVHRTLYMKLKEYDHEWFQQHLPPVLSTRLPGQDSRKRPGTMVKTLSRAVAFSANKAGASVRRPQVTFKDTLLAQVVYATAQRLAEEGYRYAIGWTTFHERIPELPATRRPLERLPLTAAAIRDVKETGEQVVMRRLNQLGRQLASDGKVVSRSELIRQCSASKYRNRPNVASALQAVHDNLVFGTTRSKHDELQGGKLP